MSKIGRAAIVKRAKIGRTRWLIIINDRRLRFEQFLARHRPLRTPGTYVDEGRLAAMIASPALAHIRETKIPT